MRGWGLQCSELGCLPPFKPSHCLAQHIKGQHQSNPSRWPTEQEGSRSIEPQTTDTKRRGASQRKGSVPPGWAPGRIGGTSRCPLPSSDSLMKACPPRLLLMGLQLFCWGRSESGQSSLPYRPLPSARCVPRGHQGHFPCWPLAKLGSLSWGRRLEKASPRPPAAIALLPFFPAPFQLPPGPCLGAS